jgi:uncharacterized protein HemY
MWPPLRAEALGCKEPTLSANAFTGLLTQLNGLAFESSRLAMAQSLIENNCLTSRQVAMLISQFRHEQTRLRLAKQAYRHTHDPANYNLLDHSLARPASRQALREFVDRQ